MDNWIFFAPRPRGQSRKLSNVCPRFCLCRSISLCWTLGWSDFRGDFYCLLFYSVWKITHIRMIIHFFFFALCCSLSLYETLVIKFIVCIAFFSKIERQECVQWNQKTREIYWGITRNTPWFSVFLPVEIWTHKNKSYEASFLLFFVSDIQFQSWKLQLLLVLCFSPPSILLEKRPNTGKYKVQCLQKTNIKKRKCTFCCCLDRLSDQILALLWTVLPNCVSF